MIEIELKARLEDKKNIIEILYKKARFAADYLKKDFYYSKANAPSIRIREDKGDFFVTRKLKTISEGMEVNDELEFKISSADDFEKLLFELGYKKYFSKIKDGKRFEIGEYTIEVHSIAGLGDFIEIERLIPPEQKQNIQNIKSEELDLLVEFGIDISQLEPRPYIEIAKSI